MCYRYSDGPFWYIDVDEIIVQSSVDFVKLRKGNNSRSVNEHKKIGKELKTPKKETGDTMKQIQRSLLVHHPRAVVAAGWVVLWLAVTTGTAGADVSGTAEEFDGEPPRRAGLLGRTTTGGVGGGNHHHLRRSPTPKFMAGDLAGPAAAARGGRPEPPQQRQQRCRNLSEILCETAIFESFCELLNDSGAYDDLAEDFSGPSWTVFAPTNTALEGELLFLLGDDDGDRYSNDTDAGGLRDDRVMTDFLGFHVIRDELVAGSDLACNDTLVMSNGGSTRVVCNIHEGDEGAVYLVGNGNTNDEHPPPRIVVADVIACNGVIHVLDNVLIDGGEAAGGDDPVEESEEPVPAAPECRSIRKFGLVGGGGTAVSVARAGTNVNPSIGSQRYTTHPALCLTVVASNHFFVCVTLVSTHSLPNPSTPSRIHRPI